MAKETCLAVILCLILPVAAVAQEASPSEAADDPVLLHAQALLAEIDGDRSTSLALLKHAQELAPGDPEIAFDRARIAYDARSPNLAEEARALLALDLSLAPPSERKDARLLRSYILLRLGKRADWRSPWRRERPGPICCPPGS